MNDTRHDGYGFWVRAYFPAETMAMPPEQLERLIEARLKVMADSVRNAAAEYRAERNQAEVT